MERLLYTLTMMFVSFMANAQSCPDNNHPHAIDLGLPSGTKWACCNVGATNPEGYGNYYAWGETEEKEKYDWTTYIHCDGSKETCHDLGSDIAGTMYDVAHVQWGGTWVMPSQDQIKELITICSSTLARVNSVGGVLFTGPSGGAIFLPEANEWREGRHNSAIRDLYNDGLHSETDPIPDACYYWASTQRVSNPSHASCILCSNGYTYWDTYNYRSSGLTVRPVVGGGEDGNRCATPTIAYDNGRLVFSCETEGAECVYEIKCADTGSGHGGEVTLSQTYEIRVHATLDGWEDSDEAVATIGWRNGQPVMEGFSSVTMEAHDGNADVNGDGKVDVADIATIISIMAGTGGGDTSCTGQAPVGRGDRHLTHFPQ